MKTTVLTSRQVASGDGFIDIALVTHCQVSIIEVKVLDSDQRDAHAFVHKGLEALAQVRRKNYKARYVSETIQAPSIHEFAVVANPLGTVCLCLRRDTEVLEPEVVFSALDRSEVEGAIVAALHPDPDPQRCMAITQKGLQCSHRAQAGGLCKLHAKRT